MSLHVGYEHGLSGKAKPDKLLIQFCPISYGRALLLCVFRNQLPERWQGKRVVNGDESDLRFNDPQGCIVGLVEKGRAKKDESGFVLN